MRKTNEEKGGMVICGACMGLVIGGIASFALGLIVTENIMQSTGIGILIGMLSAVVMIVLVTLAIEIEGS